MVQWGQAQNKINLILTLKLLLSKFKRMLGTRQGLSRLALKRIILISVGMKTKTDLTKTNSMKLVSLCAHLNSSILGEY